MTIDWRFAGIFAGIAAFLALLGGLVGGVQPFTVLFRMVLSAVVGGLLGIGVYLLVSMFLPELLSLPSPAARNEEVVLEGDEDSEVELGERGDTGEEAETLVDSEEAGYSRRYPSQSEPDADENLVEVLEEVVSESGIGIRSGMEPRDFESVTADVDALPDMASVDMFGTPAIKNTDEPADDMVVEPKRKADGAPQDPAMLAKALQTLLKKDQKG